MFIRHETSCTNVSLKVKWPSDLLAGIVFVTLSLKRKGCSNQGDNVSVQISDESEVVQAPVSKLLLLLRNEMELWVLILQTWNILFLFCLLLLTFFFISIFPYSWFPVLVWACLCLFLRLLPCCTNSFCSFSAKGDLLPTRMMPLKKIK